MHQEFFDFVGSLLAPRHQYSAIDNLVLPGDAHPSPYDQELAMSLSGRGLRSRGRFTVPEFSSPNGVALLMIVAPAAGAPVGSSADSPSWPILPNAMFPLAIDGDLLKDGVVVDPDFGG